MVSYLVILGIVATFSIGVDYAFAESTETTLELEQLGNFSFDETKGIDYYLDKYYTDSEYKIWFDENFPNLTIEEAVGLVEPYSLIKDQYYKCQAYAIERHDTAIKDQIFASGSAIGTLSKIPSLDYYMNACDSDLVALKNVAEILYEKKLYTESIMYLDRD